MNRIVCIVLGITLLSSCSEPPSTVILQREWFANAEFAGDVWAIETARSRGLILEVREGSDAVDPIKMVRAGEAAFGVASADRVLRENEQGSSLVILATASYKSPVIFLAQKGIGITSPNDFRGHTIGIQTGTNTELVFRALMNKLGISTEEMTVVESGWGTTNFEAKTLDVVAAFAYDEPVQLNRKSIEYVSIDPNDWGVNFVGTVFFARQAFVDEQPELVQDFMTSLVEGWANALRDPVSAIDRVATLFPDMDREKELVSLEVGREYFAGEENRLLYAQRERWESMGAQLKSLGLLQNFSFEQHINYRFLDKALEQQE